jgi:hypothetical protein
MNDINITKLYDIQYALTEAESDCTDYFTLKRIREANEDVRSLLEEYER